MNSPHKLFHQQADLERFDNFASLYLCIVDHVLLSHNDFGHESNVTRIVFDHQISKTHANENDTKILYFPPKTGLYFNKFLHRVNLPSSY